MKSKFKVYGLITIFYLGLSFSMNAIAEEEGDLKFKKAKFEACDKVYEEIPCDNMMCNDYLTMQHAECWRRSMNSELDKRLLKLKSADKAQYDSEMQIQKSFNQAVANVCGKNCGDSNEPTVGMRGIPYNNCRVEAYKYRAEQAKLINKNELSIERTGYGISGGARAYNNFADQLCKMPVNVWKDHKASVDCQQNVLKDITGYRFSEDVCDLS